MTTADTLTALQQAARQVTEDHALRLAIADKLEEEGSRSVPCPKCKGKKRINVYKGLTGGHMMACRECDGTGTIPDTSDRDRAEAIRLGVEAERICGGGCAVVLGTDCDGTKEWCIRCRCIARRDTIIAQHKWLSCPCPECGGLGNKSHGPIDGVCNGTGNLFLRWNDRGTAYSRATFDRGFIVVELAPEECKGSGSETVPAPLLAALARSPQWSWMVIRMRGLEPDLSSHPQRHFGWQRLSTFSRSWPNRRGEGFLRYAVEDWLFEIIKEPETKDSRCKYFDTSIAAIDALGAALWKWADTTLINSRGGL